MPIHLTSRRQFITQLGAAAALSSVESMATEVDESLIAILNDTHIGAQHPASASIPTNLRNTISYLLALPKQPAAVIINGDLALSDGQPGDYTHFAKLIEPLQEAGISLHLTMGNHDNRDVFFEVMKKMTPEDSPVESKHVGLVKLAGANLFLLDSLKAPRVPQGLLGHEQHEWLTKMLDAHADKPALVFAHHNPRLGGEEKHFPGGLEDSEPLWDILAARKHVKAYIHGHIHHRNYFHHREIHIINTPATSFVSNPKESTTGWTMAKLSATGGRFTTHTHLTDHEWNGATVDLKWRV